MINKETESSTSLAETLEIWAGVECTLNRVEDEYYDQLAWSGHSKRIEDLDSFASLGVRALRFPVLWELLQPEPDLPIDWSWADRWLDRIRNLGIRPIVGLVHHGSGPKNTNLLSEGFIHGLANFAGLVAERYPWVQDYSPVNEPMTTARFSGLYGFWYPHERGNGPFLRALVNQCAATQRAMKAIRSVNPAARLIQTEDYGRTYGTPKLTPLIDFLNQRRWLTPDLLCGRINRTHPMWKFLLEFGIREAELHAFVESPCSPDVLGANHYLTSDRFLDDGVERYPSDQHVRSGIWSFVDTEAVRACADCPVGSAGIVREMWNRYSIPVAVTEVHLGCTREEQMRWFAEAVESAQGLRREGVDLRAVTAWSWLGAFNWNVLVRRDAGYYEPGVFDVRSRNPRPTALARLVRTAAAGEKLQHPLLDSPGWWHRPERLVHSEARAHAFSRYTLATERDHSFMPRPLVILGATGTLGRTFARICDVRGITYRLVGRSFLDLCDSESIDAALSALKPWAVINAAGYVRVDDAEDDPEECILSNAFGAANLAARCARDNVKLVGFSSDLVFDGEASRPYVEGDLLNPLNCYGKSKAEMEKRVLGILPSALVIRTSAFFGPWDRANVVVQVLEALRRGDRWRAANDVIISPTSVVDLADVVLDLLIDDEAGIWHVSNPEALTWAELACKTARIAGFDESLIESVPMKSFGLPACRPRFSALASERAWLMPSLDNSLERCVQEWQALCCDIGGALQLTSGQVTGSIVQCRALL
jgi:dTDP-4-dehydrorhamnose reductase